MRAAGSPTFGRYERARTAIMVGAVVRAARHRAGMSQSELARRTRTSQPSIARLEKGQVAPTVLILDRIARALDTELVIDFEPLSASESDSTGPPPTLADRSVPVGQELLDRPGHPGGDGALT